jgi:hypothetical protein
MKMKKLGLLISICLISLNSFGWGQIGHRVVGLIAQKHLNEEAKAALFEIMGHESLVEASTWMDEIKSDSTYDHTHPWHYVTIPNGLNYQEVDKSAEGDAYEATLRMIETLKNPATTKEEKVKALRMLVHLVGDLHQPLHVGNGEDRGGNDVRIKWFYDRSNLHRIWDSGMIDSKQFAYSELAQLIDHDYDWIDSTYTSTELDLWTKEAMELRPQVYDMRDEENLSYEYMYRNWDAVKDQLLKGGLRLAAILNEIYS